MRIQLLLLLLSFRPLMAANWPEWRGPHRTGVCDETSLPVSWSTNENVRWRVPLPAPGNSTPIVWDDRIFITQAIFTGSSKSLSSRPGTRREVICFDRSSGKMLWHSGVDSAEGELTHDDNPYLSGSPATDGERVVAWFGSSGLYAYDLKGKELWHRDLGEQRHIWGHGSSPVISGNACFLNFGPGKRSFVIAVDKRTGKTLWQHDELTGDTGENKEGAKPVWIGSWSTPIIEEANLIVALPSRVVAFDPATGKEQWTCRGLTPLIYTSPLYATGILVAMAGYGGSSLAVKTGGQGDVTDTLRLWLVPRNKQRIGSGVIAGDYFFILDDPGVAECIELKSGKVVWEQRVKGQSPSTDNWSSLVLAEDKLYAINKAGDAFVLRASPKFELISTSSLGERTLSSIAPSHGNLFIRTYKALWCIGPAKKQ